MTEIQRVFKTGGTRIVEDVTMAGKSIEEIQQLLGLQYPEVKTATIRTRTEDGIQLVEFLPQPGRKG